MSDKALNALIEWKSLGEKHLHLSHKDVMIQDIPALPSFSIGMEVLEVAGHYTYLGSTVTSI